MRALLGSATYSIVDTGIWTSDRKQAKLGAMVHLHLDPPATLHGRWPRMRYDANEQTATPFQDGEIDQTVASVSDLYLLVDLHADHVVNALAGPGSIAAGSPGNPSAPSGPTSPAAGN